MHAASPANEGARLETLHRYAILDTPSEPAFDRLAVLTARAFHAPIALISLVDRDRHWFKSSVGLEIREIARASSFCDRVLESAGAFVVTDTAKDPEFRDHPLVAGPPGIRFYAGAPLRTADGLILGTLSVLDCQPRPPLTEEETANLNDLASTVMEMLDLRLAQLRQQETEAALRESEQRHRRIVETATEGIWMIDADSRTLFVNRRMADMLGYPLAEMQNRSPIACIFREDLPEAARLYHRARAGEQLYFDFRLRGRNGRPLWVSVSSCSMHDETGQFIGILGMFTDINARKEMEQRMRENEARLELAEKMGQIGTWDFDVATQSAVVSEESLRLHGLSSHGDIANLDEYLRIVHPDDRDHMREAMYAAIGGQPFFDAEYRIIRPDGSIRWVVGKAKTFFDERGVPFRLIGFTQDITERKQAEAALRLSEQHFRSLIEHAPDMISILAQDGTMLYESPSIRRVLGYEPEELIGGNALDLVHSDDLPVAKATLRDLVAQPGQALSLECRCRHKDGSWRYLEMTARNLLNDVAIGGIIINSHDSTQRREAEERLRQLSARLLQLQDEERRRLAQELHDVTGQNLAALSMNLALLEQFAQILPPKGRDALKESQSLAEQCVREIRTQSYLLHPPAMDDLGLTSAVEWYAGGFSQRSGIKTELRLPAELGRLPRDVETTVFRVIQEALTNIHRHSGSRLARIQLERQPQALVLTVEDEGRGMHAGQEFRLGVGIASMRQRLQELGGNLTIQSRQGRTTLTARIPLGAR